MSSVWGGDEEEDDIDTLSAQSMGAGKFQSWKGSRVVDRRLASRRPDQSTLAGKMADMTTDDVTRWEIEPEEVELGDKIGKGAFGTVYRGRLRGKEVAVKKLNTQDMDEEDLESFKKEVAIMSKLRHPNVLLFMGACTKPGNLMIVTELMARGSVHDMLRNAQVQLTFKQKMKMAREAALGMNWLHCSKPVFIHRDLKTGNLLVDQNYTVKVADFGLSHMKQHSQKNEGGSYGTMGTPLWMAPEVLENKPYDESADVYSFGIVLWELLTGEEPFKDIQRLDDMVERVIKQNQRPVIPDTCPPKLRELITACWDPDPKKRPRFDAILPSFDEIILEYSIKDPKGRELWKSAFMQDGKLLDKISWKHFVVAFTGHFGERVPKDPDDVRFRCLKELLVPQAAKDDLVSIEAFGNTLEWFGPMTGYNQLLDDIVNLLRNGWFHGDLSAADAEKRLTTYQKKKGSFLVRFSSREPGSYAITVISQSGKLKHYRVYHKPGLDYLIGNMECPSLQGIIQKYSEELYLKKPCPGSPFEEIFATEDQKKKNISVGYLVPNFD